jgi:starch synthase
MDGRRGRPDGCCPEVVHGARGYRAGGPIPARGSLTLGVTAAKGTVRGGPVVVANPGSVPWHWPMASAFASLGALRAYVAPVAWDPGREGRLRRLVPRAILAPVLRELRRRPIPAGVPPESVHRIATSLELLHVAIARAPLPERWATTVKYQRARSFDTRVSRMLRPDDGAVVTVSNSALASLREARRLEIRGFLDYPIAHHRYWEPLLREEAELQPEFAGTLQGHDLPASVRDRMDAEISEAQRVFVLSAFHRRTFLEAGVEGSKLIELPLGVDLELFHPEPRESDGVFRVLFVGQVTQRKGISYLLEAFRQAGIPKSELLLVGRQVGEKAGWKRLDRVRATGGMPRWELPAVYASADAFVLPSLVEGFPQTPLEAMACGVPVIVSENTFGEQVITQGQDGYVVPIRDSGAIAERLIELYSSPEKRASMGHAARKRAEHFSWDRYKQNVVAAVLGEGGRP